MMLSRIYKSREYCPNKCLTFLMGVKKTANNACTMKTCDSLKVKDAFVSGVNYFTECIGWYLDVYYVVYSVRRLY
jgi:hypothetical protein